MALQHWLGSGAQTAFENTDKEHQQTALGEVRVKNQADFNINLEGQGGEANSGLGHRDGRADLED